MYIDSASLKAFVSSARLLCSPIFSKNSVMWIYSHFAIWHILVCKTKILNTNSTNLGSDPYKSVLLYVIQSFWNCKLNCYQGCCDRPFHKTFCFIRFLIHQKWRNQQTLISLVLKVCSAYTEYVSHFTRVLSKSFPTWFINNIKTISKEITQKSPETFRRPLVVFSVTDQVLVCDVDQIVRSF